MSDSESENEYAALVQKNFERKQALLAELGLDKLLNEGKQWFSEIRERDKPRKPVRKKAVFQEMPARRSVRIKNKSNSVKYVKGFLGFDDSKGQELDDNQESDEHPTDVLNSRGPNNQDLENGHGDHNKEKSGESQDRNNKNESDVYVGEVASDQNLSLENVRPAEPDQNKTEIDKYSTPNKDCSGSVPCDQGVCEDSVGKISEPSSEIRNDTLLKEKLMDGVDKSCILNNNNYSDLLEHVEDYQNIEWDDRSEEICKQIILKHFQRSVEVKKHNNEDTDSEDDWSKYKNVMFCISASEDSDDSDDIDDSNDKISRSQRRRSYPKICYDVPAVSCEDVTEEMLANIAKRSSCKVYDQFNGTTCHQCRQKTFDTKTVCRSGRCVGVRGMFCGICLPKRYGEHVADALKNPDWECPVCRGICNCSFCRARAGKIPTGILYPEARQQGYNCVAEYLKDKDDKENISTKEKKLKILKC